MTSGGFAHSGHMISGIIAHQVPGDMKHRGMGVTAGSPGLVTVVFLSVFTTPETDT